MWELVATAVAGLNAGAGLQAALAGAPSAASDSTSFARFAGRSRMLGLLLSTAASSSCLTAYFGESRGALWLAAAAGVGLLVPFNLLMMSPPTAVVSGSSVLGPPSPRVRFPADEAAAAAVGNGAQPSVAGEDSAAVGAAGSVPPSAFAVGSEAADRSVLSAATASPAAASPRRRGGLMYSKSGMLVSPGEFEAAWSRKYWFSAFLSLTAFACMICMVGTGKDAATYGYAPY